MSMLMFIVKAAAYNIDYNIKQMIFIIKRK